MGKDYKNMVNKRISIKFCGGCNPRIDRGRIAEEVQKQLFAYGHYVSYNRLDVDFVIFISGCTADCAQRYNRSDVCFVAVAGTSVDSISVAEGDLPIEILSRVRGYFG